MPDEPVIFEPPSLTIMIGDERVSRQWAVISVSTTSTEEPNGDTASIVVHDDGMFRAPSLGTLLRVILGHGSSQEWSQSFKLEEIVRSGPPNVITLAGKAAQLPADPTGARAGAAIEQHIARLGANLITYNIAQSRAPGRRGGSACEAQLTITGQLLLRPGEMVQLEGFGDTTDDQFVASSVTHNFDVNGLTTTFAARVKPRDV